MVISIPDCKMARRRSQVCNPIDLLLHTPDCTGGIGGRFSEPEKHDKHFFRILNFLDAKAWIAADLRATTPKVPGSNPGPATKIIKGLRVIP